MKALRPSLLNDETRLDRYSTSLKADKKSQQPKSLDMKEGMMKLQAHTTQIELVNGSSMSHRTRLKLPNFY